VALAFLLHPCRQLSFDLLPTQLVVAAAPTHSIHSLLLLLLLGV
jgi:hypothetical protein